jgi:hypothetical protein
VNRPLRAGNGVADRQPNVMNFIADGDAATAYGLLCNRTSPTVVKKAVKKAIDAHALVVANDALARPFTTTCSGGRVGPTSNASADQSPIAGLFADAVGRGVGRMADAGRRAAAQTAALRSPLSTAPRPG